MWQSGFDPILNQVYYTNTEDGTVTFDLPCEISNKPRPSGFFSKISSKISLIRSRSHDRCKARSNPGSPLESPAQSPKMAAAETDSPSMTPEMDVPENSPVGSETFNQEEESYSVDSESMVESELEMPGLSRKLSFGSYMFQPAFQLHDSDASTISSIDSIQSFHSELSRNDIYYDYETSLYVDSKSLHYVDFDKEKERYELRQQILQELY